MKKIILAIVFAAFAQKIQAQSEVEIRNSIPAMKSAAEEIMSEKAKVYSNDSALSVHLGGKPFIYYLIKGDSAAIFDLLDNEGFGSIQKKVSEKRVKEYFDGDEGDLPMYYIRENGGNWIGHRDKEMKIKSLQEDVRKEIELAQDSEFEILEIEAKEVWANLHIEERFEYVDKNGQNVNLVVFFMNGQLQGFDFQR